MLLFLTAGNLVAVPRFAMMEEVNCASCHSYQGGGAGRSSYGKDYISESLVMKDVSYPWKNEERESLIYFGLDTRYQMIASRGDDLRQFPMQFAGYAGVELANLLAHVEVNRIIEEFRFSGGLRYEGLPLETWISVMHELPIMGWRIDDHTVFTRGGNISTLGLEREGMPYTPFIEAPTLIEIGSTPVMGLDVSLMVGTPFIQQGETSEASLFNAIKTSYNYYGNLFTAQVGLAALQEGDVRALIATTAMAAQGFVWLGEFSKMEAWPQLGESNFASLQQLSYRLFQGLDIVGRYEFFDPNSALQTGAIQRVSLGFEAFPIPGLEVKLSYRRSQLDLPATTSDPEAQFLGQFHLYL